MSTPTPTLPPLTEATIDRIEARVMDAAHHDRAGRHRRRRTAWTVAASAAAVLVVAAVISPAVVGGIGGAASDEAGVIATDGAFEPAPGGVLPGDAAPESLDGAIIGGQGSAGDASASQSAPDRELIASGSMRVLVGDVDAAAEAIAEDAQARGGYVESLNVGRTDLVIDPATGTSMPAPVDGAWITVRVPADELPAAMAEAGARGEVTSSSVSRVDVTEQAQDLRARLAAAEASVARLTELMAQSDSVADLIAAETALAERQAELESYRQQLEQLEEQVELSSLTVELAVERTEVRADPAGFGDGLVTGWNSMIAALNGFVVALGFLLPWLAVIALAGALVWGVRALVRRRRASQQRPRGDS